MNNSKSRRVGGGFTKVRTLKNESGFLTAAAFFALLPTMGADHPGKKDRCLLHGRTAESEDNRSIRTHSGCLPLQSQPGYR